MKNGHEEKAVRLYNYERPFLVALSSQTLLYLVGRGLLISAGGNTAGLSGGG